MNVIVRYRLQQNTTLGHWPNKNSIYDRASPCRGIAQSKLVSSSWKSSSITTDTKTGPFWKMKILKSWERLVSESNEGWPPQSSYGQWPCPVMIVAMSSYITMKIGHVRLWTIAMPNNGEWPCPVMKIDHVQWWRLIMSSDEEWSCPTMDNSHVKRWRWVMCSYGQ
jgi:hypothetical protein